MISGFWSVTITKNRRGWRGWMKFVLVYHEACICSSIWKLYIRFRTNQWNSNRFESIRIRIESNHLIFDSFHSNRIRIESELYFDSIRFDSNWFEYIIWFNSNCFEYIIQFELIWFTWFDSNWLIRIYNNNWFESMIWNKYTIYNKWKIFILMYIL